MQKKRDILKEASYWSKIIVLGVVLGAGLQFASAVWTPAPADPLLGDVSGPITTADGQIKDGNLILNTGLNGILPSANGLIVANGNVGIGTVDPVAKLEIKDAISPKFDIQIGKDLNTMHSDIPTADGIVIKSGTVAGLSISSASLSAISLGIDDENMSAILQTTLDSSSHGSLFFRRYQHQNPEGKFVFDTILDDGVGSQRMDLVVDTLGNVGIGEDHPQAKLDVAGKILTQSTVGSDPGNTVVTKDYADSKSAPMLIRKTKAYKGDPADNDANGALFCDPGYRAVLCQNFREAPVVNEYPFGGIKFAFKATLTDDYPSLFSPGGCVASYCGADDTFQCTAVALCQKQ